MTKTYEQRKQELEMENLNKLSIQFLGSPLVEDTDWEMDSEGNEHHSYRTEDGAYIFVPQLNNPVMARTLREERKTGRYHYSVEIGVSSGGSYWETPDYDQVEIAREPNLFKAIIAAAHHRLNQDINGFSEGMFWDTQNILDSEFPPEW